jgi:hypothetical protein
MLDYTFKMHYEKISPAMTSVTKVTLNLVKARRLPQCAVHTLPANNKKKSSTLECSGKSNK